MDKITPQSTVKSNGEIWSHIYAYENIGNDPNEKFFSGAGSHDEKIIVPYMNTLLSLLTNNNIRNIVDVGCGDFWIMRHVLGTLSKNNYNFFYTGVDVVEELVKYNAEHFRHPNIKFICMDAAGDDTLPDGEILIIRQALQHMRNADIKKILGKAEKFKYLFITEHIYDAPDAIPNIDKENSNTIRLTNKSGVYLEHAPFNVKNIVHLLKVVQWGGVIRSSLIIN